MGQDIAITEIAGAGKELLMLHITDSHICVPEDAGDRYGVNSTRMHNAYAEYNRVGAFQTLLDGAQERRVDLIALTGDIVNYPGPNAVQLVRTMLDAAGIPWVYTAGNHDWHYEGLAGSSWELRKRWRKNLAPLYRGLDPHCGELTVGGIRFLMIDNSNYQFDERQCTFFDSHVGDAESCVLLTHIPLSTQSLRDSLPGLVACGDPRWGWETDKNWEIEQRERWPKSGNRPSTDAFLSSVASSDRLAGVFCGHIHTSRTDTINARAKQYVTAPGYSGNSRLVRFT